MRLGLLRGGQRQFELGRLHGGEQQVGDGGVHVGYAEALAAGLRQGARVRLADVDRLVPVARVQRPAAAGAEDDPLQQGQAFARRAGRGHGRQLAIGRQLRLVGQVRPAR